MVMEQIDDGLMLRGFR